MVVRETAYDVAYKDGYATGYQDGFRCAKLATTPPTTDVVLVSREEAAKVAEAHMGHGDWCNPAEDCQTASVNAIAKAIRALPPYGKE